MANKMGLLQKIKVSFFWFTQPQFKNILTVTCEHCGSTNVTAHDKETAVEDGGVRTYIAYYECRNCGAACECVQIWDRNIGIGSPNLVVGFPQTK